MVRVKIWLNMLKDFTHKTYDGLVKTAVTPLLTHWSYCSLVLSHRYVFVQALFGETKSFSIEPKHSCSGPNASNPARGRTLPGQERPSNGRPDASQRRPGSMLCPVGLPGALSVDILALLLY